VTQPNELLPDTAFNYDSLAAVAAKPQEDWEAEIRGRATGGHVNILSVLFNGLPTGMSFPLALLTVIARALTGSVNAVWGDVEELLDDVPVIGDFIEIITGKEDGDLNDLGTWTRNLMRLLANPAQLASAEFHLTGALRRLLQSLGPIPAGSISADRPNLHPVPGFPEGSILAGSEWSVDMSTTRTDDGTGAAKLVCDGRYHALRTGDGPGDHIPVAAGQKITETIYVRHQGYSGVGDDPILLQVVPFQGDVQLAPVTLDTYAPETSDLLDWPGHQLTNAEPWEVPAGVTSYDARALVTDGALAGTLWFDDDAGRQAATLPSHLVDGLPQALQSLFGLWQTLLDTIVNTLRSTGAVGNTLADLVEALSNITPTLIAGVNGAIDLVESFTQMLSAIAGGAVGAVGAIVSNAQAFNIFHILGSNSFLGQLAYQLLGIRANTPASGGLLPTGQPNIDFAAINTTVEATPTASLIGVHRVTVSQAAGVLSWRGYRAGGMTALYVVIRKIDNVTGSRVPVFTSPNLIGYTNTSMAYGFYELVSPLPLVATEQYEVEWIPVGGSFYMRGIDFADSVDDHPFSALKSLGATRNSSAAPTSPGTIAKASVTPSTKVPWFEMAIDLGTEGDNHEPQVVTLDISGDYIIPRPPWATEYDYVIAPAGGGGYTGSLLGYGRPGLAGDWVTGTAKLGVDFDDDMEEVAVHVGTGGVVGGDAAEDSTVIIPDLTVTAPGGANATNFQLTRPVARGLGSIEYNGRPYVGGGDQNATGGHGIAPGGPGNGGRNFLTLSGVQSGGRGADATVWLVFRQGESVDPSTDPPTPPTDIDLIDSSPSSLTVEISGGS
jgi:hypothetical protein